MMDVICKCCCGHFQLLIKSSFKGVPLNPPAFRPLLCFKVNISRPRCNCSSSANYAPRRTSKNASLLFEFLLLIHIPLSFLRRKDLPLSYSTVERAPIAGSTILCFCFLHVVSHSRSDTERSEILLSTDQDAFVLCRSMPYCMLYPSCTIRHTQC